MKHSDEYRINHESKWSRDVENSYKSDGIATRYIVFAVLFLTCPPLFTVLPTEWQAAFIKLVSLVLHLFSFVSTRY